MTGLNLVDLVSMPITFGTRALLCDAVVTLVLIWIHPHIGKMRGRSGGAGETGAAVRGDSGPGVADPSLCQRCRA